MHEVKVRELMTTDLITLEKDETIDLAKEIMLEAPFIDII